jgi:hypothetical protein
VTDSQAEARATLLNDPLALVLVERGVRRALVFHCPSGCGEVLSINLDLRAGPAWTVRIAQDELSLLPSVWRTEGCKAHFVLWRNSVWWCRFDDVDDTWPDDMDRELRDEWRRLRAGGKD